MSLNKKVLTSAIAAGLLFSAGVNAQVVLGEDEARVYAQELTKPVVLNDANDTAVVALGYNFSAGEVRHARFECTGGIEMGSPTVTSSDTDLIEVGAVNGINSNALYFSLTGDDTITGSDATADVKISVDANNTLTSNDDVDCALSLYDQPSQAGNGGEAGLISTTGYEPFIQSRPGFVFAGHPGVATANVEAPGGAYYQFVGGASAVFGGLTFERAMYDGAPAFLENGAQYTLGAVFTTDTTIEIAGDFTAAEDVIIDGYGSADDLDDGVAEFNWDPVALSEADIRYVATIDDAIVESDYVATLNPVLTSSTRFTVGDVASQDVGEIVRNGTQLQAPLVQYPGGGRWQSRVVLTNTGNVARAYEISVQTEADVDVNEIGAMTGEIPANKTVVLNVNDLVSFPGRARATLNVTVAAPNNQIQGLYQIVDVDNGGISNETMVRPGTN